MNMKKLDGIIQKFDTGLYVHDQMVFGIMDELIEHSARTEALEKRVSRIESRPLPRKVSRDFAGFDARLEAVSKVVAGIDCLSDALKRKANELDDRVEKIERHGVPRRIYKDFVNSEERLAAVEKKLAALEGRLATEKQDRSDSHAAAFNAWYDQKNKVEALEKRLAALEEAHKVGAHNAAELYDATDRKADDARAEVSELRARVEDLEEAEDLLGELVRKADEFAESDGVEAHNASELLEALAQNVGAAIEILKAFKAGCDAAAARQKEKAE